MEEGETGECEESQFSGNPRTRCTAAMPMDLPVSPRVLKLLAKLTLSQRKPGSRPSRGDTQGLRQVEKARDGGTRV